MTLKFGIVIGSSFGLFTENICKNINSKKENEEERI
jgi:hypothetical protein